jgi:archaemetzincin
MAIEVHIWWIGADAADDRLLASVRSWTERVFRVNARPYRHADRPTHAFDPRRGQHSSTAILKWLVGRPHPGGRMLALTDADLFIPVLTFVYGEAQLGGAAAVVSTARLSADGQGARDASVFADRVLKECVHELGHTFGLIHCDTPGCVMTRSVNILEVDAKRIALCELCEARFIELRNKDGHHEQGTHTHPRR